MSVVPESEHHPHFGELPVSTGFPRPVQIGGAIGIVMIFIMGFLSFFLSSYGHHWPAESAMRVPLNPGGVPGKAETPNGT